MTKYIARLNGAIVGKRTSDRTYTHAIVTYRDGYAPAVATWCGRPDLAQGEQRKRSGNGWTAVAVPVEIEAPKNRKAVDTLPSNDRVAAAFNDAIAGTAAGKAFKFVAG
jgi:hypothetical protein